MAGDNILRHLAIVNMVEGCIVVLLQLSVLITLHDWVDWICIGFWGGGLMVLAGMWALQRSQKKMIPTAVLAILGGLCMIGFYSWNVSVIDCKDYNIDRHDESKGNWEDENPELCQWRVASDILFIIFGCLTLVTNMFMAAKASTLVGSHARRSSDSSGHVPRPAAHAMAQAQPPVAVHHHTMYVTPTGTYPAPYPDQHQMASAYPTQQVSYPAYPSQPAYNPGYPAPQAPPYYKE